jgi:hypothetical protein
MSNGTGTTQWYQRFAKIDPLSVVAEVPLIVKNLQATY